MWLLSPAVPYLQETALCRSQLECDRLQTIAVIVATGSKSTIQIVYCTVSVTRYQHLFVL